MKKNLTLPRNRALLVGINDYKTINDLQGCINDVTNMRNILKTYFGFTNDDIRILVDERATKKNILYRLEKMVAEANPDDTLVFHFSGHGSQIRDRDNDELNDHMDELICPYNLSWEDGFITDDMLRAVLNKLKKGVKMEIILDCCHSGSGTRDMILDPPGCSGTKVLFKNRFLRPPVDIECRYQGEEYKMKPARAFKTDKEIILNHVLWAGCRDNQTSADAYIEGRYNGAFSYYFCKHIRDTKGKLSRDELHSRISDSLNQNNYNQLPQLECRDNLESGNVFN